MGKSAGIHAMAMEMNFGKALDIWSRVVSGDNSLTVEKVKAAVKWFDDFISELSNKASQSKQELDDVDTAQEKDAIEKMSKAAESDKRQLYDFIRKLDDLIGWLNSHK